MAKNTPTADDLDTFDALVKRHEEKGYVGDEFVESLYPINPETGLPSLPEGYLWRVFKEYGRYTLALIHRSEKVQKELTFWGFLTGATRERTVVKERQIETWAVDRTHTDPVVAIYSASVSLLGYMAGQIKEEVQPMDLDVYVGDYPPKNIHTAGD